MRLSLTRTDAILTATAALMVLLYVGMSPGGFPLDDSWIHQTYGRNLAETGLWAFMPGVPSAASTSPLYTALLALGYTLRVPYALWTHGLGIAALAGTGLIASRMARRLAPDARGMGLVAGLAVILSWHLIWAAASGMETALFSLWTLVLPALAWRELDGLSRRMEHMLLRGMVFGALAGVAFLTRPEGVVLAALVGAAVVIERPQGSWRGVMTWGIGAVVGFAAVTTPYLLYNLRQTGGLLPDTAAAKQAEYAALLAQPYLTRILSLFTPLAAGAQTLLLPGVVTFVIRVLFQRQSVADNSSSNPPLRRFSPPSPPFLHFSAAASRVLAGVPVGRVGEGGREVRFLLLAPLVYSVIHVGLYAARLPANYQHGRYVIPALPALLLCGVVGMAWLIRRRSSLPVRVVTRALGLSAAVVAVLMAINGAVIYRQDVRIINEEMVAAARWIAANVPSDDFLAVHDIGAVGYFAPRPIFDLAGLVTPEVVPIIRDGAALWEMMEARGAAYLMAFPDQIPGQNPNAPRLCEVYNTGGATARAMGQPNMAVYALVWDGACEE